MNKKVLTLCAAMLLTGSLATVNAASVLPNAEVVEQSITVEDAVIDFTDDLDLKGDYLLINDDNVTINGNGHTLTGRLVINAKGVKVNNLNVIVKPSKDASVYKNAITVISEGGVVIDGGTIKAEEGEFAQSNGVSIFPTAADATFEIKNVVFEDITGYSYPQGADFESTAIAVTGESDIQFGLDGDEATFSPISVVGLTDVAKQVTISNCTFDNCDINFSYAGWADGNAPAYHNVEVTPNYDEDGNCINAVTVQRMVTRAAEDAKGIVFKGTAEQFIDILAKASESFSNKDAAVQCSDANLLFGNAEAPDNTNPVTYVLVGADGKVTAAQTSAASSIGGYKLVETAGNDGNYYMLGVYNGTTYFVVNSDNEIKEFKPEYASDPDYLWTMTGDQNPLTKVWTYRFQNKATDGYLEAEATEGTGIGGDFCSKEGTAYYNGLYMNLNSTEGKLNNGEGESTYYYWGLYEAGELAFTADDLNEILKPGFGMTIKIAKDNDKAIEGVEVFGKTMYAVEIPGSNAVKIVDKLDKDGTVADDANYLVLDKAGWDGISANSQLNGEFIWVSGKDLVDTDLNKNWYDEFEFLYSASKEETDILTRLYVPGVDASAYILSVNGINYLTTKKSISGTETWPYIKLAPQNIVNVKTLLGKYWNITFAEKTVANKDEEYKLNGGVVAVVQREDKAAPKADYVKASSVLLTSPETQWAVVSVNADGSFTFQNRENSDVKIENVVLRSNGTNYTIYTTNTELEGDEVKLASHTITGTVHMDGFMDAKPGELRDKVFHIGQYHYETGNSTAFWAENHQANRSHQLGVVTDEEAAVDWKLSIEMQKDRDGLETAYADTMYVITKLAALNNNGGIDNYKAADTLAILQYKFQNKGNLEYVIFNDAANQEYYQCQEDKPNEATALHFALKLKPDSTYNVVSVVENEGKRKDALGNKKIYVANSQQWGSLKQMPTYGEDNNSLMQVIPVDRPEYRKVQMAWGDTIKLWRNENESEVLYEQRNDKAIVADKALSFLNIENENDPKFDINPALFVDTAYINRWDADGVKNTCYQYLLVVNPKNVSEYYCPLTPEHNTDAWRESNGGPCPDAKKSTYVEGRFLVNMIDTANVYGLEHLHNNPYINRTEEGADRAKLAFVDGIHAGDTLYLFRGNGDTIKLNLNTPDFNVAKFAFKYEDVEEGSFKIQTQYKEYLATNTSYTEAKDFAEAYEDDIHGNIHNNEGYLRWTNGCIVVDHTYQKGDVFNMTERYTEQNPTANETITAEGAVSVVATDGAVVIKGAEGKNVVIATILGKVVANETINSDNETIAVPAGIAVVSVDGESFKVVVK